jgi:hypothetical protein
VGPRAGLDDVEKRKFLTLSGLELRPSAVQPVASRYTDCPIPAPLIKIVLKINIKEQIVVQNVSIKYKRLRKGKTISHK